MRFVSVGQLKFFSLAFTLGVILGAVYMLIAYPIKKKANNLTKTVIDVLFFAFSAAGYVYFTYKFNFPSFRPYMVIGFFLGIVSYTKSFHYILAKCLGMAYNKIRKQKIRGRKNSWKKKPLLAQIPKQKE